MMRLPITCDDEADDAATRFTTLFRRVQSARDQAADSILSLPLVQVLQMSVEETQLLQKQMKVKLEVHGKNAERRVRNFRTSISIGSSLELNHALT